MNAHCFGLSPSRALLGLFAASLGLFGADAGAQSLGKCSSFYAAGFSVAQGKVNPAMPSLAKPAQGAVVKEPNFNTCLVRATNHAAPATEFARNDYSRRQAFNANNSFFIVYSGGGWWHLYDANTMKYLRALSPRVPNPTIPAEFHLAADAEPQWHPTDPNVLYYLPTNGGTKLLKLDVRTNTYSVAADFAGKLPSWASTARHIWTKSEGSPSADGRYWGFQVENSSFGLLGYMVWDLQDNKLVGSVQNRDRPDHSSMSASGRWYVTSSDSVGTWAWSPDFTRKKKLLHKSEHSDLALGPNGQDYYVSIDFQSNNGDFFYVDVDACPSVAASATDAPECPRTVLFPTYVNGGHSSFHISGKGFKKPGWVVASTYGSAASRDGTYPWFSNKVFALELKANPRVYPLAYTRRVDGGSYWSEPQASVSRDFTRIAFNSNWGSASDDIDDYIVHIPSTALPGGTTTTRPGHVTGGNSQPAQLPGSSSAPIAQGSGISVSGNGSPADGSAGSTPEGRNVVWISRGERLVRRTSAAMRGASRYLTSYATSRRLRAAMLAVPSVAWWHDAFDNEQR